MDLVDGERCLVHRTVPAVAHPLLVPPHMMGLRDDGRGGRRHLRAPGHRVGAQCVCSVRPADVEFVQRALADPGHEQLPYAGGAERAHRQGGAVPVVEIAGDPDSLGVRSPDSEAGAGHALMDHGLGAERPPQFLMSALTDEMQVELPERGQESVRILHLQLVDLLRRRPVRLGDVAVADEQRVGGYLVQRQDTGEEAVTVVVECGPAVPGDHGDRVRVGTQRPEGHTARNRVRPQQPVRIVVRAAEQPHPVPVVQRRRGEQPRTDRPGAGSRRGYRGLPRVPARYGR